MNMATNICGINTKRESCNCYHQNTVIENCFDDKSSKIKILLKLFLDVFGSQTNNIFYFFTIFLTL